MEVYLKVSGLMLSHQEGKNSIPGCYSTLQYVLSMEEDGGETLIKRGKIDC